jgi:ATP-dependent exoDNAse (exonuclease V) alpha subunit
MAIYYLGMKSFGRARGKTGSRATSAAAYRAGERIRDERSGATYDHRGRRDVLHKEIILPSRFSGLDSRLAWARERASLWNAAEHAERRSNSRVAREFTAALPHELSPPQRTALARRFAQELSDRYRGAIDLVIHAPRGDPRNYHAHLLATTREIGVDGFGAKTTLEMSSTARHERGLPRWKEEVASVRERWAALTNEALKAAHLDARIEYRPFDAKAAAPVTMPRLPLAAYHIERRGERSFVAERVRERHRARLVAAERERAVQPNDTARDAARRWLAYTRARAAATAAVDDLEGATIRGRVNRRDNDFGL